MNSQTARRPERPTRSAKSKKYVKQTAHVEARRDGKPLIFGWGGHLSRHEKTQIQRRAIWALAVLIGLLIITIIVGYWVNINIIVPNLPITSVNGQNIPQSDYRKLVVLNAQLANNKIEGPNGLNAQRDNLGKQASDQQKIVTDTTKKLDDLNKQINALPAGTSEQRTKLEQERTSTKAQLTTAQTKYDQLNAQYQNLNQATIPQEKQRFTQSQVGTDSATWLQDNALITQWLDKQSNDVKARVEPTSADIDNAIKDFKANLPKSKKYDQFLSSNNLSESDLRAMMTVKVRRDKMQDYQASLIVSPTYQVQARGMTINTEQDAKNILKQLQNGSGDFAKIAKQKSVDTNSNTKGGDLGWLARGQYIQTYATNLSAIVDKWIFDPARKPNELSPVLYENGTYHIIQIMKIDPSRTIDDATLKSLKTNALTTWLLYQKALPGVKITSVDQDKLLSSMNMPSWLPASPPGQGLPNGLPGGQPDGQPGSDGQSGGQPGAGGLPGGQPGGSTP